MREKPSAKDLPESWPKDKHGFPIIPKGHWPYAVVADQERNVQQLARDFYAGKVREEFKNGTPAWMMLYFFCNECGWFKAFICSSEGEICSECGKGHVHDKPARAIWTGIHPQIIALSRAWVDCHKLWDGLNAHFKAEARRA